MKQPNNNQNLLAQVKTLKTYVNKGIKSHNNSNVP